LENFTRDEAQVGVEDVTEQNLRAGIDDDYFYALASLSVERNDKCSGGL
jgi:plasmid replication initiation protein